MVTGFGISIAEWGAVMHMARRAAMLAVEDGKRNGVLSNPLNASIGLYTDDPTISALFSRQADMADICGVSQIEFSACVGTGPMPPAAFEAERPDDDAPRVAALLFKAAGGACPRCRKVAGLGEAGLCARCTRVCGSMAA